MAEKPQSAPPSTSPTPATPAPARRGNAFRSDAADPMVELTERAKLISQEAGTKVSTAMRDMISAAAGIAGFAVESARDLVQYMVRRGQMTQEEADRLIREAEASHMKRPAAERAKLTASKIAAEKAAAAKKAALAAANLAPPVHRPLVPTRTITPPAPAAAKLVATEKAPAKPEPVKAAKAPKAPPKAPPKPAAKPAAKVAAKKPAAKPPKKAAAKKRR